MLSVDDCNHLKLMYDHFLKINSQIRELIEENNWDDIEIAIKNKDKLINEIMFFEKPRIEEIKSNSELYSLRKNLMDLEEENINIIKNMKDSLFCEIKKVKKAKKILNTYEPETNRAGSTFEIKEEI